MTVRDLVNQLRAIAASKYALEKKVLEEAADKLEEQEERIDIMREGWGKEY